MPHSLLFRQAGEHTPLSIDKDDGVRRDERVCGHQSDVFARLLDDGERPELSVRERAITSSRGSSGAATPIDGCLGLIWRVVVRREIDACCP